ncbi:MAG: hypothetical protein ACTSVV_18915 [Promethearchaeota archaeon]
MEEITKSELLERIPKQNCILTIIDEDLTENTQKVEDIIAQLDVEIERTMGFCFLGGTNKYFFWKYDPTSNKYLFYECEKELEFYLHSKLRTKLENSKI